MEHSFLPIENEIIKFHSLKRRALIITYYWPPAGGPGVQRWLKFVKYFREFDVEPIVYVPENPHYPITDTSFKSDIPSDITILKHPIREPYRLAGLISKKKTKSISSGIISKNEPSILERILLYIRGNYFIPDARVGWVKPSVIYLQDYLSTNPIDVVITTGPPHSLHLIGLRLKEQLNVNWIADFRDPWTTIHYHKSLRLTRSAELKHKKLESGVLKSADAIVVTSPTTKKEFERITEKEITVITNGYDIEEGVITNLDTQFTCAHIGSLLSDRNPKVLWKVLSEIIEEIPSFKTDLQLLFAGMISDDVISDISSFGLTENLKLVGYVSHDAAVQLQFNAQLLLLVEIDSTETRSIIPGKLFEYLRAKRPILALGPEGSDISKIISDTESGSFFTYQEGSKLKEQIISYYNRYKEGKLNISSSKIEQYSRRELTAKMAHVILKFS